MSYEVMNSSIHSEFHGNPDKGRDRHFVTWSEEEDNILREQVRIRGTERWSVIASQLGNKTGRQCRRRWNTYLSIPYKKGGWSPEEDKILFEAHKKFGNRWTEIAKVVQGRTDNAVKNRFNALHRKLEKRKLCKENDDDIGIIVNKRVVPESSVKTLGSTIFCKKMRNQFVNCSEGMDLQREEHVIRTKAASGTFQGGAAIKPGIQGGEPDSIHQSRGPLSILFHENSINSKESGLSAHSRPHHSFSVIKGPIQQVSKLQGNFLEKDDPRLSALAQQAELLSSLAQRRNAETSNQETENAWKATNGILIEGIDSLLMADNQMKDQSPNFNPTANGSTPYNDMTSKDKCQDVTHLPSKRLHIHSLPKLCESCENITESSPEFSVGSNLDDAPKCNILQADSSEFVSEDKSLQTCSTNTEGQEQVSSGSEDGSSCSTAVQYAHSSKTTEEKDERLVPITSEYCSPTQVIPYLRSSVDEIPSPHFSESERQFILSVLDPESEIPSLAYCSQSLRCAPLCRISLSNRL